MPSEHRTVRELSGVPHLACQLERSRMQDANGVGIAVHRRARTVRVVLARCSTLLHLLRACENGPYHARMIHITFACRLVANTRNTHQLRCLRLIRLTEKLAQYDVAMGSGDAHCAVGYRERPSTCGTLT